MKKEKKQIHFYKSEAMLGDNEEVIDAYRNLNIDKHIPIKQRPHTFSACDVEFKQDGTPKVARGKLQRGADDLGLYRRFAVLFDVITCTNESDLAAMREGDNRRVGIWFRGIDATGSFAPMPTPDAIRISINPKVDKSWVFADSRYPHLERKPAPTRFKRVYFTPEGAFVVLHKK